MKKFLLLAMVVCCYFNSIKAQDPKEYKKVQTAFLIQKFEDAKTEIDKLSSDPKLQDKPLTYLWKAKVYATLYKNDATRVKYSQTDKIASESFDKCMDIYSQLKQDTSELRTVAFDLYSTSFNQGISAFNGKKWDSALVHFENATKYSDVIFSRKWSSSTQPFDTTSVLYSGYSAQNAKKVDIATKYYCRLIDNKVITFSGEPLLDSYRFVLIDFSDHKDSASFYKYYPICQTAFPKENWEDYELDYINKNYSILEKVALYDKEHAAGKLNETKYLLFGDMFVNPTKEEKATLDSAKHAELQVKAKDCFKNAFAKNNQNAIAAFNVGIIYYNEFNTIDDKFHANIKAIQNINATKPVEKDPKKRAATEAKYKLLIEPYKKANEELDKPLTESIDGSIEWIEKAFSLLKEKKAAGSLIATEKNIYNKSVDFLANLYAYKRDRVRGKDSKAFDAYDEKYKLYDSLHSND